MKIAVRGGHNYKAPGATALINEVVEDRKVRDAVIKYLKKENHNVLDVTPNNMDSKADLKFGVDKANNWGADLFISIHFNNCYLSYNGALGSEVCVFKNNDVAQRVVNKLGSLGFKNRGQKIRSNLYELKNTKCPAIIIETCFVEATEDVALYKRLGHNAVGKAIVEGIINKSINKDYREKIVAYFGDADLFSAAILSQKMHCALIKEADLKDNKNKDIIKVGGANSSVRKGDRFVTFKGVADLL